MLIRLSNCCITICLRCLPALSGRASFASFVFVLLLGFFFCSSGSLFRLTSDASGLSLEMGDMPLCHSGSNTRQKQKTCPFHSPELASQPALAALSFVNKSLR